MRRPLSLGACVLLLTLSLSPRPLLAQQPQVVAGADNPAVDVPAVQAAVDRGGKIILRGTFDFGVDAGNHIIVPGRGSPAQDLKGGSTVFIYQHDVTISGETGSHGELLTVVKNGMPPFWIGWDGEAYRTPPAGVENVDYGSETFPQDAEGRVQYRDGAVDPGYNGSQIRYARGYQNVSATIKNIYFDSPLHYGVKATAGRDVVVIGNVFSKVQFGGLVHVNGLNGPGTSSGATHIAVGAMGVSLFYAPFIFGTITGEIRMEENVVDEVGTEAIPTYFGETFGFGALITNAAVRIQGNTIRNVGRQPNGASSDVILAGAVMVADNYASPPLLAENIIQNTSAFGIWDAAFLASSPGARIERNRFTDCGITGVLVESYAGPREGVSVYSNSMAQDGLQAKGQSFIVANNVSACTINSNTFAGDLAGPLVALGSATNCTVQANKDKRKTVSPESPTYFLDSLSSGNLIKAATGTAVDSGTNNTILLPKQ